MDSVSDMIDVSGSDSKVKNVMFHFHSPGGTCQGTPELASQIELLGHVKNTMAFTDGDCMSGAFWLAQQCNQYYSTESAELGSVGVRMILLDESRRLENEGLKVNAISSGKYKLSGASFQPLTVEEREMFQSECDAIYERFKSACNARRVVREQWMNGQSYSGEIAAANGITDGVVSGIGQAMMLFPSRIMP
jgi:protease-4